MSVNEYMAMAKDGFDLAQNTSIPFVNRSDIAAVITVQCGSLFGFWGGGVACQNGSFINGASIQVKPLVEGNTSYDNTALNNIKMVCDDGAELSSMGNDEGDWS